MQGRGNKYVDIFFMVVLSIITGCGAARKTGKTHEDGAFIKYRNLRVYPCNEGEELFRGYVNADPAKNFRMTVITKRGIVVGRIYAVDSNIFIINTIGRKYYREELADQMWKGLEKLVFGPPGEGIIDINYNNEKNIFKYEIRASSEKEGRQIKVEWRRKKTKICWNIKIGNVVLNDEGKFISIPDNLKENYTEVNNIDEVFQ